MLCGSQISVEVHWALLPLENTQSGHRYSEDEDLAMADRYEGFIDAVSEMILQIRGAL